MQEIYFAVYRENGISGAETVFPIVEITTTDGSVYQLNYDLLPSQANNSSGGSFRPNFYLDEYFAGGEEITLEPGSPFICHVYPGDDAYKLKLEIREDGHEETRTFYLPDKTKSIESFRLIGESAFSGTLQELTQDEWNSFSFAQATMPATEAVTAPPQTTAAEIQTIILTEPATEQPDVQKPAGNTSLLPWILGGALLLAGAAAAVLYFSRVGKQVNQFEDYDPLLEEQERKTSEMPQGFFSLPQNRHDARIEEDDEVKKQEMRQGARIDVNSNAGKSRFDNPEQTAKPKKEAGRKPILGNLKWRTDSPTPDDHAIKEAISQVNENFQQVGQSPAPRTSGMGGKTNQGKVTTAEEIAMNTPPLDEATTKIVYAENVRTAVQNKPQTNSPSAIEEFMPNQNNRSPKHVPPSRSAGAVEEIEIDWSKRSDDTHPEDKRGAWGRRACAGDSLPYASGERQQENSCPTFHRIGGQHISGDSPAVSEANAGQSSSAVRSPHSEEEAYTYYDFLPKKCCLVKSEGYHRASEFRLEGNRLVPNPLMNARARNEHIRQNREIAEKYFVIAESGEDRHAVVNPDDINDLTAVQKGTLVLPPKK